jgi:predicted nicotinamide N-methyase
MRAGTPSELLADGGRGALHAIDLRTFASRAECDAAAPARAQDCIEIVCVRDLENLVDRDELLRNTAGTEPPYWALPWIGARAIAARLRESKIAPAASALDLGCGLGLSGVVAGLAGAHVTFTDYVEDALEFAEANARLHELKGFEVRCVDFTRDRLDRTFDWILAADVVYDPAAYLPLVDFLDAHLAPAGTLLLTESLRADARKVLEMLAARAIRGRREDRWLREDGRSERTWLHVLTRKAAS